MGKCNIWSFRLFALSIGLASGETFHWLGARDDISQLRRVVCLTFFPQCRGGMEEEQKRAD